MFEGDLWLPKEQIEAAKNGMDPTNVGGVRGLSRNRQWPGGIVYYTISTSKWELLLPEDIKFYFYKMHFKAATYMQYSRAIELATG